MLLSLHHVVALASTMITPAARFAVPTRTPPPIVAKLGTPPDSALAKKYDLIVVGGGPAGVAGALRGAYLGRRVLLVDKPKAAPPSGGLDPFFAGPTGLFSKALRDCAKSLDASKLSLMGLDRNVIFKQVQNSCLLLAKNNAQSQGLMLSRFKVDYLQGTVALDAWEAEAASDGCIAMTVQPHAAPEDSVALRADKLLLCTGSYPRRPPGIPFDGVQVFDSDTINTLSFLPRSAVVVGSGIIAIEYAKIFRKLGAEVTMIVRGTAMSALERIGLDETIAERLLAALREDGVTVLEDTVVSGFDFGAKENGGGGEEAEAADEEYPAMWCAEDEDVRPIRFALAKSSDESDAGHVDAELYLACLGRSPRTKGTGLGLEAAGIELTERAGFIAVNKSCFQTSRKGVYAAGDCIEGPALASTGVDQAQRAAQAMFAGRRPWRRDAPFPIGVWTIPEVGYYGLTQRDAIKQGYDAEVGVATYDMCLRGRVFAPDGMLKLVFDRDTAIILGVHIIGTDACELTHYGMDLVAKKASLFDVLNTLFTAVTFHELFKEAALNGNGKLEFGIEWQELLSEIGAQMTNGKAYDEAELRKSFNEIDVSGNGSLDEGELVEVFGKLGMELDKSVVPNLIRLADDDGNGTIEWPEFNKIFQTIKKLEELAPKPAS